MRIRVWRVGGGFSLVLAFVAWAFVHQSADAAVTRAWVRQNTSVVSNSQDVAAAILRDPFGNIIVAGNTEDGFSSGMLLLKYSSNGSLLWHRRFSGPTNSYAFIAAAAVDAHGNIAITGYSFNGEDNDYYTAKFSPQGTLLWVRSYDGPSDDAALAVAFDKSGNVIVTGGSSQDEWRNDDDGLTRLDYYTAKYAAADGALLWERRYNGPGDGRDQARAVALDVSNNVIVTGYSRGEVDSEQYTAKYAAGDGALLWERRYAGYGAGHALALDASGNVIVAGQSADDAHTVKYSGVDGTLLWEKRRDGPSAYQDVVNAVAVDSSGNVFITGHLYVDFETGTDAYIAKYAAVDGALLWERVYNSAANNSDAGQSVAVDRNGNVVVGGYSFDMTGWQWNQFTIKHAGADGAVLWERLQDGPQFRQGMITAVVLDGADNVAVAGSFGAGYDSDISTAKLAGASGAVLWEQRYNGPAHRFGFGRAVVIDVHGNVFVTGQSEGDDTEMDYLTVKYAPNGAVLWERRYDGPRHSTDAPLALALDAEGNLVVTGYSWGVGTGYDYYTAKYAGADGSLLWEQRYNGAGNWTDAAYDLAIDSSGNVVVTGNSDSAFYTAKYAASNGALLWERRFSNAVGHATAAGLAMDASGDVVVTGTIWTGPSARNDIYTVKYAAANGQTLWERQYNSPDNGYDEAVAVAMDGEGNAFVTARSDDSYTVKYAAATGEVIWEQSHNRGSPWVLAVDAQGNAIVSSGYTVKYAGNNGAVLWDRTIEDSPNQTTFTRAIAVDAAGNVFLGGMFYNGSNYDFFTAKYASTDGAVLWRQNDDGPGQADDRVEYQGAHGALAIGPNGMVALTGTAGGYHHSGHDFTTVVYRDTPGDLPQIRIAAPASGSQWIAGGAIALVAEVSDPDSIVDSVEFFAGDRSVGVSSASPWTVAWANVPAGTYILTARTMDALGPITVSEAVTITVTNPPPSPTVNVFALDRYARERSFFYPADTASFLVHRSGSLNSDLTVYYDVGGSASNGVDYVQLPGRVTIRAGHRVALVVIVPRRDSVREVREDVRITLRPPPASAAAYRIGRYPQGSVYIFD